MRTPTELLIARRADLNSIEDWDAITTWHARTRPLIAMEFSEQLPKFDEYIRVKWVALPRIYYSDGPNPANDRLEASERSQNAAIIRASRDRLLALIDTLIELTPNSAPQKSTDTHEGVVSSSSIFIVHGHDSDMKHSVARVIHKLNLNAIILHEQPDGAKTIIEKFEKNASEVGFAVILMSPDDMGYSKADGPKKAEPRARQNVVMELGYFVGKLGRDKVMVLKRGDVKEPSDINGVVYTPFDDHDGWQHKLVKELHAAGYTVDANALIK